MQQRGRDNELISFLEFCNFASNLQVDLNFPDDVLAVAQGDPVQNDISLENRNLIQNPNPSLLNPYPNQNQNQEQGLVSPFEGMHLNPNFNNLMEQQCMPSNQNYMARPPCQPYTNVTNVASISRGETDISHSSRKRGDGITMNRPTYNGIGNSASEPMQQNIEGFVRNTQMRVDPGQGRTSMVAVSPNTAQYNMVFSGPNPNPSQPMTNPALASDTLSIPLARTNSTLRQPMRNRVLASNTLLIPLARPNPNPGQLITLAFNPLLIPLAGGNSIPRSNLSPMQIIPATAGRVTSQSWPVALPSSDHELAQFRAMLSELADFTNQRTTSHHDLARLRVMLADQRTTSHQQPIRATASSDASQIRSQGVSLHQAVPVSTIPSVPASSTLSVSVPDHTASTSQTGNSGVWPSSLPPIFSRLPRGTSSIVALQRVQARWSREIMARNLVRDLHPDADERQLVVTFCAFLTLLSGIREMRDELREIDRHVDMRLDTDHMSHEELLALAERIGSLSTGVSEEIVNERMGQGLFSALLEKESEPCCICQEEYVEDDQVGTLDCGHNFHRECIKKWLGYKNLCPICKRPGIGT